MNLTPTVSVLELFWAFVSLYIGFYAVRWLVSTFARGESSSLASRIIASVGWYALIVAILNAAAGLLVMTVAPAGADDDVPRNPAISIIATSCLILALVSLAVFMTYIERLWKQLVQLFRDRESTLEKQGHDIERLENITSSAVQGLEDVANAQLAKDGKEPFTPIAPVKPEHHSEITEEQRRDARYQTLMARIVAARLLLDLTLVEDNGVKESK